MASRLNKRLKPAMAYSNSELLTCQHPACFGIVKGELSATQEGF